MHEAGSQKLDAADNPRRAAGVRQLISPRAQLGLGVSLTAIAGYVDAIGFIELGGLFASFMSGASVSLGVGVGEGQWAPVYEGAFLIAVFLCGATAATVIAGLAGLWALPMVMLLEGGLLAGAALLTGTGFAASLAILPAVAAMGVQNMALRPVDGVRLGVTFMTGTLVSVGQALGAALLGRARPWSWSGHALVWCAFSAGAAAGAAVYAVFDFIAISVPAAMVASLSALVAIVVLIRKRKLRVGQFEPIA
jgi:uncharacterized membrane protein YoaK (UPF0700 family)